MSAEPSFKWFWFSVSQASFSNSNVPLILVCHLDVVDPDVKAPDVDSWYRVGQLFHQWGLETLTIETTLVAATDNHVIDLTLVAGVKGQMERWGIDKSNVVNSKVCYYPELAFGVEPEVLLMVVSP